MLILNTAKRIENPLALGSILEGIRVVIVVEFDSVLVGFVVVVGTGFGVE